MLNNNYPCNCCPRLVLSPLDGTHSLLACGVRNVPLSAERLTHSCISEQKWQRCGFRKRALNKESKQRI